MTVARIAVVAGDGIGTEVVAQARKVHRRRAARVSSTTEYDLGAARYHRTGEVLPDSPCSTSWPATTRSCSAPSATRPCRPACSSAACCSSCGSPSTSTSTCARRGSGPGTTSPLAGVKPGEIDLVVVREGTEGLYAGAGGIAAPGHPGRDRHRGEPEHPARRRAGHPRRVRPRRPPRAPQGHAGAQDQRAHPRRRPVGAHLRRGRRRVPRRRRPSTSTSTRPRCSW